jgi:hypothetical protein
MAGWVVRGSGCVVGRALLLAIAIGLLAARAEARPEYPGQLQNAVGLECPPPCLMCHTNPNGGVGWNRFGTRILGLAPSVNPWSVVLAGLRQAAQDSDGDGVNDIDELERGTNPSIAGPVAIDCVRYGCGARIARGAPPDPFALATTLGLLGLLRVLRRQFRAHGRG